MPGMNEFALNEFYRFPNLKLVESRVNLASVYFTTQLKILKLLITPKLALFLSSVVVNDFQRHCGTAAAAAVGMSSKFTAKSC